MPNSYAFLCRCGEPRVQRTTTCGNSRCTYRRFSELDPGKQAILLGEGRVWLSEATHTWVSSSFVVPALDRYYDGGFAQFWADNQVLIDEPVTFVVILTHLSTNLPLPLAKALDALVDQMLDDLLWQEVVRFMAPPCANISQAGKPRPKH